MTRALVNRNLRGAGAAQMGALAGAADRLWPGGAHAAWTSCGVRAHEMDAWRMNAMEAATRLVCASSATNGRNEGVRHVSGCLLRFA